MSKYDSIRSTVVFDIETYAKPAAKQPAHIIEGLTKYCKNDEERQDVTDKLGLYSVAGEIACVAMLDPVRKRAAIFYREDLGQVTAVDEVEFEGTRIPLNLQTKPNEAELVDSVSEALSNYDAMISYNGRTFDCPFLMQRALILNVPVKKHLFGNRYNSRHHLDLCDYISGFGSSRKISLDLLMRAMGFISPKAEGIDGSQVSPLIDQGKIQDVANYCMRDVVATAQLAKRVANVFARDLKDYQSLLQCD